MSASSSSLWLTSRKITLSLAVVSNRTALSSLVSLPANFSAQVTSASGSVVCLRAARPRVSLARHLAKGKGLAHLVGVAGEEGSEENEEPEVSKMMCVVVSVSEPATACARARRHACPEMVDRCGTRGTDLRVEAAVAGEDRLIAAEAVAAAESVVLSRNRRVQLLPNQALRLLVAAGAARQQTERAQRCLNRFIRILLPLSLALLERLAAAEIALPQLSARFACHLAQPQHRRRRGAHGIGAASIARRSRTEHLRSPPHRRRDLARRQVCAQTIQFGLC